MFSEVLLTSLVTRKSQLERKNLTCTIRIYPVQCKITACQPALPALNSSFLFECSDIQKHLFKPFDTPNQPAMSVQHALKVDLGFTSGFRKIL
jgi:hypothetical protein